MVFMLSEDEAYLKREETEAQASFKQNPTFLQAFRSLGQYRRARSEFERPAQISLDQVSYLPSFNWLFVGNLFAGARNSVRNYFS